jgi:adenylate cyclase, class 2
VIEVELKAHIEDKAAVERRLASFAKFLRPVDKRDSYWHGPDWKRERGSKGFRVRSEGSALIVTFKTKRMEGGVEVNREREFGISDAEAFREFVERIGCEPYYRKHKTGVAYRYDGMMLELLDVEGVGVFLEIERLLDSDAPETISKARKDVHAALALAGIPESAIEPRTYSELILGCR